MNALNAIVFAALGSLMEVLPKAFPSWFPPTGSNEYSDRVLWLAVMGAVQVAIGAGFLVRSVVLPVVYRLLAGNPANQSGSLALPSTRGVTVR
jgi:hypothetical protein